MFREPALQAKTKVSTPPTPTPNTRRKKALKAKHIEFSPTNISGYFTVGAESQPAAWLPQDKGMHAASGVKGQSYSVRPVSP